MIHQSKNLILLTIMDAPDQRLSGETERALSVDTMKTIVGAADTIPTDVSQGTAHPVSSGNLRTLKSPGYPWQRQELKMPEKQRVFLCSNHKNLYKIFIL